MPQSSGRVRAEDPEGKPGAGGSVSWAALLLTFSFLCRELSPSDLGNAGLPSPRSAQGLSSPGSASRPWPQSPLWSSVSGAPAPPTCGQGQGNSGRVSGWPGDAVTSPPWAQGPCLPSWASLLLVELHLPQLRTWRPPSPTCSLSPSGRPPGRGHLRALDPQDHGAGRRAGTRAQAWRLAGRALAPHPLSAWPRAVGPD